MGRTRPGGRLDPRRVARDHGGVARGAEWPNRHHPAIDETGWTTLLVPGEPRAFARPRVGRGPGGRTVIYEANDYREWKRTLRFVLRTRFYEIDNSRPWAARITVAFPMPERGAPTVWRIGTPDADNVAKGILDAAKGIIWADDSQVCYLLTTTVYSADRSAGIRFSVRPIIEEDRV